MNSDSPRSHSCQEFCLALKAARERKGITLDEIAEATKIAASHFAALERGDLRRWPTGLFRRSFFRDYARMIDLPVAEACAEFMRWFPDGTGGPAPPHTPVVIAEAHDDRGHDIDARLILDETWSGPRTPILLRLSAAILDAAIISLLTAALVPFVANPFAVLGIIAMTYFSLGTLVLGGSPAQWVRERWSLLAALKEIPAFVAGEWKGAVSGIANLIRPGAEAADTAEEPEQRVWVSDARRVGPPRLRVRIKMSE